MPDAALDTLPFDPDAPLVASGNLRRRQLVTEVVRYGARAATTIAVVALVGVTVDVVREGVSAMSWTFLTHDPPQFGGTGGGIASAIVGTVLIVAVGAVIAIPLGVLCALYLTEITGPRSRGARLVQLTLDMMQGLPTVVVGLFFLGLVVDTMHAETGLAGALALSMIMLPLIARTAQEVLLTVPQGLRDASAALGVERWRSVLTVVLPTAASGILTGAIIAIARAAGETAPLLIVDGTFANKTTIDLFGQAVPNIPVLIFTLLEQANASGFPRAWGAALVLFGLILIANITARVLLALNRRRMGL